MAKYTLICEHDEFDGTLKTSTEFRSDFLPEVLENVELFLRGAGFYFDGRLEIFNDDVQIEEEYDPGVFSQIVQSHMDYLDKKECCGGCDSKSSRPVANCDICGLSMDVMRGQKCYDANCPKNEQ